MEKDLLPSLSFTAAGVEGLRVFLILPELLNKLEHKTNLTESYVSAILNLDPCMLTVLGKIYDDVAHHI